MINAEKPPGVPHAWRSIGSGHGGCAALEHRLREKSRKTASHVPTVFNRFLKNALEWARHRGDAVRVRLLKTSAGSVDFIIRRV